MFLKGIAKERSSKCPGVLEHSSVPSPQETLQQVTSVLWVYTGLGPLSEETHSCLGIGAAVC